jgi:hypothetical protein
MGAFGAVDDFAADRLESDVRRLCEEPSGDACDLPDQAPRRRRADAIGMRRSGPRYLHDQIRMRMGCKTIGRNPAVISR